MRTRIKICGITNGNDARAAIECGADALGFILVPESPRYVANPRALFEELPRIPPFLTRTAVCLSPDALDDESLRHFDAVQFYQPPQNQTAPLRQRQIRAFRIRDRGSLEEIAAALHNMALDALMLDTYHKDKLGGSGETFNWELASEAQARFALPIILAGGLTPDNVVDAIRTVRPYAVDVSSGVEAEPGRKDHDKLRAFFQAVRQADPDV